LVKIPEKEDQYSKVESSMLQETNVEKFEEPASKKQNKEE
jgi:hypothetical protein